MEMIFISMDKSMQGQNVTSDILKMILRPYHALLVVQPWYNNCRGQSWSYYETCMLIDIWSNPKFKFQLESSYRNNATFEKVACLMKKNVYNRSLTNAD